MDGPPPVLLPCSICTRTFRPEVLERHMKICEKASVKKRRPFDSFKSRVSGTELEEFLGPATLPGQPIKRPDKSPKKKPVNRAPKWKETHETLIATLRAARGDADDNVNLNKHAGNDQCPSCGRYFGPRAFDRHVEFCKEKMSRIKVTPSKFSHAQERLEARINYRAPLSLKPKLTTKEKYSPMLPRKADSSEICTPTKSTPVNLAVKTPKPVPTKANQNQFSRQSPTRTSQRQRSVSPTKKSVIGNSRVGTNKNELQVRQTSTPKIKDSLKDHDDLRPKTTVKLTAQDKIRREKKDENYDPYKQAERQMMALLSWPSTVDLKTNNGINPSSPPRLSPSRNLQTSPTSAFTKYLNKDGKASKDINENLNRTKTDKTDVETGKQNNHERTYTAADDWEEIFEKHFDLNRNDVSDKMTKSVKSALDGLLKKSPKKIDLMNLSVSTPDKNKTNRSDTSVIKDMIYTSTPKSFNSDSSKKFRTPEPKPKTPSTYRKISGDVYGRISPPDDFGDVIGKENIENKINRNSGISLSSLSFSSQVSDTTLADEEVSRNHLEIIGVSTPRSTRRKFARSQSVFDERNKMLFAKTFDRNFSSSDENELDQTLPNIVQKKLENKNPQSAPFKFPRSQSVADDRRKGDGDHSDEGDNVSSPETNKSRKAKMSGDSAYSSLNRKSPHPNVLPLNQHNDDRLSSSGSENSLPPLNNDHSFKPKSLDFDSLSGKADQPFKMSKFCHECGSKYPVPIAKFCCECGVRRLII